ncbi:hypothetical protein B0A52_02722 [Exophiala mesophila]|uniref:CFEM domain-containing protein n=1 Tax=Exophiala mesophila TaxID=212818 RepID=A0A438NDF9_EXOME|nr:hypothetical protein B0A52_02722 [Exophiala mesophila]
MKPALTAGLLTYALFVQQAASTSWGDQPVFSNPDHSDNKCNVDQNNGFNWDKLPNGGFSDYGGMKFGGFDCKNSFQPKNRKRSLEPRTNFKSKCIQGTVGKSAASGPKISSGDKFSIDSFDISVEFDIDLDFIFSMPDGSKCKHTAPCKKSGSTVKNTQCGGAKDVTFQIPPSNKNKDCDFGIHTIKFDCRSKTKTSTTTRATSTTTTSLTTTTTPVTTTTKFVPPPPETTTTTTTTTKDIDFPPPPPVTTTTPGVDVPPPPPVITTTTTTSKPDEQPPPPPETTTTTTTTEPPPPETTTTTTSKPGEQPPPPPQTTTTTTEPGKEPPPPETTTTTTSKPGEQPPPPPATTTTPPKDDDQPPPPPIKTTTTTTEDVPPPPPVTTMTTTSKPDEQPPPPPATTMTTTSKPYEQPPPPPATTTTTPFTSFTMPPPDTTTTTTTTSSVAPPPPPPPPPPPSSPCPPVLPRCLNTWLDLVSSCKSNSDSKCFCPSADFIVKVQECVSAWSGSDDEVTAALSYLAGICADYVPQNPGICTGIPSTITLIPQPPPFTDDAVIVTEPATNGIGRGPRPPITAAPTGPVTVVTYTRTVEGKPVPATVTVPQVIFITTDTPPEVTAAPDTPPVPEVGLVPFAPALVTATEPPSPQGPAKTDVPTGGSTVPASGGSGPDVFIGAASRQSVGVSAIAAVLLAGVAFLV